MDMPYLSDHRDRVLLGATPTLMQPRFGVLPALADGAYRYIAAEDGLYLEAQSWCLSALVPVARSRTPLPYGRLTPGLIYRLGHPLMGLFQEAERRAQRASPVEWAGVIVGEGAGAYRLVEPAVERASPVAIRYANAGFDPDALLFDLHSHGQGAAYFSETDDASDREGGIFIAGVIGRCNTRPEWALRLVVHGRFFTLDPASLGLHPASQSATDRLSAAPCRNFVA